MPITVTPKAADEILRVLNEQQLDNNETMLRLGIQGNCSGISYSMTFEKKEDINPLDDLVYVFDKLSVVVSRESDAQLDKAVIDFYDQENRRGFTFDNPNFNPNTYIPERNGVGCSSGCRGCG